MGCLMISLTALKSALKSYEDKNYKKCIKICDGNLEDLGSADISADFLCLKGIALHSLGKIEQGYECVKKGLQVNFRSGLGWHLYAMMLKSDKRYTDSAKAFRSAINIEPSNQGLQKELSLLLMQLRDKTGFLDLRLDFLSSNSTNLLNICAAAYALLLSREYLPYIFIVKALVILSNDCRYFPALICISNSKSLVMTASFAHEEKLFLLNRQLTGIYSEIQIYLTLNKLDSALSMLQSCKNPKYSEDRNLSILYLTVLGEKVFQESEYFDSWIFKLTEIFKPEISSEESLIEKFISIQAWDFLCRFGELYISMGNVQKALLLYYKILSNFSDAVGDTYEFANYCFKRATINSCYNMQYLKKSCSSSKIYNQIIWGILSSLLLSGKGDCRKVSVENPEFQDSFENLYSKFFQFSYTNIFEESRFLMVLQFYRSGFHVLMRHFIARSCKRVIDSSIPDDWLQAYVIHIFELSNHSLYANATVIPITIVETNLDLFIRSAKLLKLNEPLIYVKSKKLISLYFPIGAIKNKLLGIQDL